MLDERGQPLSAALASRVERVWAGATQPHDDVPRCFPSAKSFLLWLRSWSPGKDPEVTFCTDCTARRREAMASQDRCHFPNTTFDVDDDGWTRGNRR